MKQEWMFVTWKVPEAASSSCARFIWTMYGKPCSGVRYFSPLSQPWKSCLPGNALSCMWVR